MASSALATTARSLIPSWMSVREATVLAFSGWVVHRLLQRPPLQLRGSLILVTGASQGVGREICKHLTARGANVVMVARSADLLETLRREIEGRGWGGHAYSEACDCSDGDAVALMSQRVLRTHGVPDAVLHCAGAGEFRFLHEMQCEGVRGCVKAPLLAAAYVSRAFLPHMRDRDTGSLAIVQSPVSRCAIPGASAYSANRAALQGFVDGLRREVKDSSIVVQEIILPGLDSNYWSNNPNSFQRLPWLTPYLGIPEKVPCGVAAVWVLDALVHRKKTAVYPLILSAYTSLYDIIPGVPAVFRLLMRGSGFTMLSSKAKIPALPGARPPPSPKQPPPPSSPRTMFSSASAAASPMVAKPSGGGGGRGGVSPYKEGDGPNEIVRKLSEGKSRLALLERRIAERKREAESRSLPAATRANANAALAELESARAEILRYQVELQAKYEAHFPQLFKGGASAKPAPAARDEEEDGQTDAPTSGPDRSPEAKMAGIGVTLSSEHNGLQVVVIEDGGAASQTDLKRGDVLLKVDGVPTIGRSCEEAVRMLMGPPGSFVTITVKPSALGAQVREIKVKRQ